MSSEQRDPRTPIEKVYDFTDSRLIDNYHRAGLLEADPEATYSLEHVMRLMRAAYWRGAEDQRLDPCSIDQAALEHVATIRAERDQDSATL
jgi:hypothetical protein